MRIPFGNEKISDADDDAGDVVGAAAAVGQVEEKIAGVLRGGGRAEHLG
jgi:hypothetical protein